MGIRGPAPTPLSILKLRGSWRGDLHPDAPEPELGRPRCPKWMSKNARSVWRTILPLLEGLKVLTKADGFALVRYCYMTVAWQRCQEFLDKHGDAYPILDRAGKPRGFMSFPQARRELELADRLLRIEQQFGLTPSARARLQTLPEPVKDELDEFLTDKRKQAQ